MNKTVRADTTNMIVFFLFSSMPRRRNIASDVPTTSLNVVRTEADEGDPAMLPAKYLNFLSASDDEAFDLLK